MQRIGEIVEAKIAFVAMLILPIACHAQAVDAPGIAQAVDAIFQDQNKGSVPGCVVGIRQEGSLSLVRSYGSADLERDVAINPSTVFEAGSVSKQFTAASILLLAEQGKLAVTDDVRKYIPELPVYGTPITIDELLSHTSGLRDWGEVEAMAGWPRTSRVYTLNDVLNVAARQKSLNYRPATAYSYTNTGFNLLAIIVERVSKETLAQFSQKHLFEPLGMSHTQWRDDFRRIVKGRAIAYEVANAVYQQQMPFEDTYGHGGLLTTVGDLLRWNEALTAGDLGTFVTTEIQRQATLNTGHVIAYARGLEVRSYHGVREIAHPGATAGYRAWLGRYPDQHLSIALLCNAGDVDPIALAHSVADLFLPARAFAPPTAITLTANQITERGGLYIDLRTGLPLRVDAQGESLRLLGGPILAAASPYEFSDGSTTFRFGGNDRVTRESSNGDVHEFKRMKPWQPISTELLGLAGSYESDEAMVTYHLTVRHEDVIIAPDGRCGQTLTLRPLVTDSFEIAKDNTGDHRIAGVVHFTRGSSGRVSGFEMSSLRVHNLAFHRIAGETGCDAELYTKNCSRCIAPLPSRHMVRQ